jgi:hypothetical protein
MLGTDGAVWLATQAIGNDAVRPSPAGQMSKLFADEPLATQLSMDDMLRSENARLCAK